MYSLPTSVNVIIFVRTNFYGWNKNDTFLGFKICGALLNIFSSLEFGCLLQTKLSMTTLMFHITYRKLPFHQIQGFLNW